MALKFSLDLEGATFDELATFVESLKTAGMKDHDTLTLDGTQLVATVEPTGGQVSGRKTVDKCNAGGKRYGRFHALYLHPR